MNPILASQTASATALIHAALTTGIPSSPSAPADLQWMPPGKHKIRASRGNGNPFEGEVWATPATATKLNAWLQAARAKAARGEADLPYFDFNHEDREASAFPLEFFWAGEDPVTGGVRAKVEWSAAGRAAVEGKAFRRFSPSFYTDPAGEVIAADLNAGGLVNRAAFQKIAPIWSREERDPNPNPGGTPAPIQKAPSTMNEELKKLLLKAGLITAADVSDATAVEQIIAKHTAVSGELTQARESIKKSNESLADRTIEAAVKAGKIKAKDDPTAKRYRDLIVADPANAALVENLSVDPTLAKLQEEVIKTVHGERKIDAKAAGDGEHELLVKAKEYATANKCDEDTAITAVARTHPELYEDYTNQLISAKAPAKS